MKFTNGEEFDAEVAKFSLERMANPANNLKMTALRTIARVEVKDKYTIHIVTHKPFPTLDAHLTLRGAMLPPKYFKEKDKAFLARNPVGTGAFKFVTWVKDDRIEFEANEQWWHGAPQIKTLIFRPIPEETTRMSALQTGEVDIATNVPPHLVKELKNHPKVTVSSAPSVRTIFIPIYNVQCEMVQGSYDCTKPYPGPTANPKVRQAINYAVDVDAIIKNVLEGQAIRTATPLTAKHFGYDPTLKPFPYDPAKAKKLLAEAGYPNGIDLVLNSPNGRYPKDKEVAEAVAGQLTKAGIRTQLKVHEWTTYMTNMAYRHNAGPHVADRLGQHGVGCGLHLHPHVPDEPDPGQLLEPGLQQPAGGRADEHGSEEAPADLRQGEPLLHRRCAGHPAVPADRQLRRQPEGPVDGPARRADRRLQHGRETVANAFSRQRSAFSRAPEAGAYVERSGKPAER